MINYFYKYNYKNNDIELIELLDDYIINDQIVIDNYDSKFNIFKNYIEKNGITTGIEIERKYSDEVLEEASFFTIRANKNIGYPVPENSYQELYFSNPNNHCDCKIEQVKPIHIKKDIKWKKRNFFTPFWLYDLLFISKIVKDMIKDSELKGVCIEKVYKGVKKPIFLDDVFQLKVSHKVNTNEEVNYSEYIHQITECNYCKARHIYTSLDAEVVCDKFELRNKNVDLLYLGNTFGKRRIIISKTFRDMLIESNLTNGVVLTPIFDKDHIDVVNETPRINSRETFINSFLNYDTDTKWLIVNDKKEKIIVPDLSKLM
ncbi:hypothetical protein [Haloplasma contractile]|uniref:Uncharacterized protein n=1 Tax=Haloplasma contractile SSD-17B TaxID=1033810 RepID=U2FDL7_9MOLU|nr:hypothetical protein [Haloplasma contractile]ERJ11070.1 hypothetical protein HLPCO_002891 [Haloplasma contractile SSD-17B]